MREKTAKKLLNKVVRDYSEISKEFSQTRKNEWSEFENFSPYIKENSQIADLGCGNGRLYKFLKRHKKIKYIGIDNNKKLLKEAEKNTKAKFIYGSLLKLPLPPSKTDMTFMIASFHHIPSKKLRIKALLEAARILKTTGTLIISVWNLFQPKYKKYVRQSYLKYIFSLGKYDIRDTFIPWGKTGIKRYYHAFTLNELRNLLHQANFEIIKEDIGKNFTLICKKSK